MAGASRWRRRVPRRWSVRARLTTVVAGLLAASLAVVGAAAVWWTRATLLDELDDSLLRARAEPQRAGPLPAPEVDPSGRSVAVLRFDGSGRLVAARRSGSSIDPDPIPRLDAADLAVDGIGEATSERGTTRYRYVTAPGREGGTVVYASPLDAVDGTVERLVQVLGAGVLLVLVVGSGAAWWLVGRGLRPIDDVASTALDVAAGDLSRRVGGWPASTEVGRLAAAFDHMLSRLDVSFAEQEQARRRLEQLVADAAHELRTPLATVDGYAELHRRGGLAGDSEVDEAMRRIGAQAARMRRLVDDLLLLAWLDEGHRAGPASAGRDPDGDRLRVDRVDLAVLVADAVRDHGILDPTRPVHLDAPSSVVVPGDADLLEQAVVNLLSNVRAHTPAGTAVRVAVRSHQRGAELVVADSGPGIRAEDADRVTDRFWRADPSRSRRSGGAGLGLSIAAAVVRRHGGTWAVEQTAGGGATIRVGLPG
ncbi:MAG: sensor histidine kinase [Phycicoccus sp.]